MFLKQRYGVVQPDRDTPCLAALLIVIGERSTRDCAMLPSELLLARHCLLRQNPNCACLKSPGAQGGVRRRQCHRSTPRPGSVNYDLRSCRAMLHYSQRMIRGCLVSSSLLATVFATCFQYLQIPPVVRLRVVLCCEPRLKQDRQQDADECCSVLSARGKSAVQGCSGGATTVLTRYEDSCGLSACTHPQIWIISHKLVVALECAPWRSSAARRSAAAAAVYGQS